MESPILGTSTLRSTVLVQIDNEEIPKAPHKRKMQTYTYPTISKTYPVNMNHILGSKIFKNLLYLLMIQNFEFMMILADHQ